MMTRSRDMVMRVLRESTLPLKPSEILSRLQKLGMYQDTPRKSAIQDINATLKKLAEQKKAVCAMGAGGISEWSDLVPAPEFKPAKVAKPKPLKAAPQDRPITVLFSLPPDKARAWADELNGLTYTLNPTMSIMCKELEGFLRKGIKSPEVMQ